MTFARARIDTAAWPVPPIFRLIQQRGDVPPGEMYRVFNMGIGLVFAVAPDDVSAVLNEVEGAIPIGEVVPWTGQPVQLLGL